MNVALRRIRNNRAVMLLAKRWPDNLPPPVHVSDTEAKARAVSLLRWMPTADHEPVHACDLTPAQARDVVQRFA
jgi:hypothetical protein